MIDDFEREVRQVLRRRSKVPGVLMIVSVMVGIASASFWFTYGHLVSSAFVTAPPDVPPVIATGENNSVTREDIESLKQQIDGSSKLASEDLNAQKTDLKKLSDQVTALADKIDDLQAAQRAISAHAEIQPKPVARSPAAARKRPVAPKPKEPSPTGGALLSVTPAE
jgi:septal ring factor EnvC (AmiA/AmiB activator)